ncbi:hypothetical protein DAPPUDRAFT_110472 [Daphnia pulex]|uniref:Uncharacterized protein n=1 Tax=Daphnia pulex TaxID=6669 RepID=E9H6C8_DAPPU|nr:hypothetical protein DAPPUDRAFT_110473 [Daphnia pulex]EFX72721.1 hypothetical protein DAPPUDRAFT_110472 [Daphnia pulex]|eukprot:EFX72636.1 hypothetical protein DAPPUDRAFT_110473 [Daphnia pulex]
MVEALRLLPVIQRKFREDGHHNVAVNPLSATPLFSPSFFARAALFGLVVFMPRGRKVAKPKTCRKAPVKAMHYRDFPLVDAVMDFPVAVSALTCQQWQVPLGHGSFRRGA